MSQHLEITAIQAVFHRQLNTERAIKYVVVKTGVSPDQARSALQTVMTAYKG